MKRTIGTLISGMLLLGVPAAQQAAAQTVAPAPRATPAPAVAPVVAPVVAPAPFLAIPAAPAIPPAAPAASAAVVVPAAPAAPAPAALAMMIAAATTAGARVWRGEMLPSSRPPAPWAQGDPADSIYRSAREALNRGDYRTAAGEFQRIGQRYPHSSYAPDALYWQAYALYRIGGSDNLQAALNALQAQREHYAQAATRGDAETLAVRIRGELARTGDASAAAEIAQAADAMRASRPAMEEAAAAEAAAARASRSAIQEATRQAAEAGRQAAEVGRQEAAAAREAAGMAASEGDVAFSGDQEKVPPGCAQSAESTDVRVAALNALLQMDAQRALPILRDVLQRRDSCSVPLRRKAVFLVAQGNSPEAADVLLDAARNDPDPGVRSQAVFWLSQVAPDKAVPALVQILKTSKDVKLQERALFALSQQNDPRASASLKAYAERKDVPESLREKAVFWIGQRGRPQDVQFLERIFESASSPALKEQILFAVSQAGHDGDGAAWLLGVARDAHQPMAVRKKALFAAGQAGAPVTDLTSVYRTGDRALKEQVIFVLSQSKDPVAVTQLIDIARNEKDPALREKAIFWLGQSHDPRATKVLQEIINHG